MTIGDNIKKYRQSINMSQESLAKRLNVTQQAVDSWERLKTTPRKKTIDKLSKIFNITPNDLFGYVDKQKDKRPADANKFLAHTEVLFDGEIHSLTPDDKQKIREALEYIYYRAKARNKRKKD